MADDPQSGEGTASEAPAAEAPATAAVPAAPEPVRNKRGQWLPGVSGKPGGGRKWRLELQADITERNAERVPFMMEALYAYTLRALRDNRPYAIAAWNSWMDRVTGKVPQRIIEEKMPDEGRDIWSRLTEEQLDKIIADDGALPPDLAGEEERASG